MIEPELKEIIELIKPLISKNGILVNGIGIVNMKLDKQIEIQDKQQKFLYFLENRQKIMEQQNNEIIGLLKAIATKLK